MPAMRPRQVQIIGTSSSLPRLRSRDSATRSRRASIIARLTPSSGGTRRSCFGLGLLALCWAAASCSTWLAAAGADAEPPLRVATRHPRRAHRSSESTRIPGRLPAPCPAATRTEIRFLALLDIDDFKFLNDRHGHPHGDTVLDRSRRCCATVAPATAPIEIGGDEFADPLAQRQADRRRAILAQRLRRACGGGNEGQHRHRRPPPGETARRAPRRSRRRPLRSKASRRRPESPFRRHPRPNHRHKHRPAKTPCADLIDETGSHRLPADLDLDTGYLLGLEALTRPDAKYDLSGPAEAFDIAEQIGRVHELDVLCINSALSHTPELPADTLLFINLCPQTLDLDADRDDWLLDAIQQSGGRPTKP